MTTASRIGAALLVLLSACASSSPDSPTPQTQPSGSSQPSVPAPGIPSMPGAVPPPTTGIGTGGVGAAPGPATTPGVSPGAPPPAPAGQPAPVSEMPPDPNNWIGLGGDVTQVFARPLADIQESNLKDLGAASWQGTAGGGVTGTPAIYDGIVYWADWVGNVHAQRITDGMEVWNPPVKFPRGFTSSPFVTADKVFLSDRDKLVIALDRMTGKELWRTSISDNPLAQLWSSPTVADGVVVVGLGCKGSGNGASNDGTPWLQSDLMAFRGAVVGLDAATGKVRWRFEVTKANGMSYGPGVSVWSSAALDTVRKVAYVGTGNSYYSPASPYSDSLIALNYMTDKPEGELVWSKQFTKDDNFTAGMPIGPDSDVGATPNLFTFNGKDYVAVGDKGGWVYVMDRQSGEFAFERIAAGSGAGTGTSTRVGVIAPAAYGDGVLYVTANYSGATRVLAIDIATGMTKWSANDMSGVSFGAPLLLKDVLLIGTTNGAPATATRGGEVRAYRRADGTRVPWSLPVKNQRGGGISIYRNTLFIPYGYVFENRRAEDGLVGGVLVAALGGKVVEPGPVGPTLTYAPTFKAIYTEIFAEKGCTMGFCHGGSNLMIGDQATAHMNLLQGKSSACGDMPYVVPGKPDESLLYKKLQPSPACGRQMPDGLAPLTPEAMTQVRTWIEMGAPNN